MRRREHNLPTILAALAATVFVTAALARSVAAQEAPPADAGNPATATDARIPTGARVTDEGWFAPRIASHLRPLPDNVPLAAIIPIRSPIYIPMPDILRQKVATARELGATMIVFDMDTPGGSGAVMDEIVRYIMDDLSDLRTVAYVDREAMSAGAIISLACDEIVMHPSATFGDAMPIMIGPNGLVEIPPAERTKVETAARASLRVVAEKRGYNAALCEAMITISKEVWLIRNLKTRELRYVDAKDWRYKADGAPPVRGDAAVNPADSTGHKPPEWEYLRTVEHPDDLLTLTANEALDLGFTEHLFENMDQLQAHYHIAEIVRLEHTTVHKIAEFMNSMAISSLLVTITLLLAYMEIRTPGFGVAGVLALTCLGVLIGSRYVLELASHWEIVVMAVGLLMLLVEVFVTPGFGVLGISGIVLMVAGFLATGIRGANPDIFSFPKTTIDWRLLADTGTGLMLGLVGAVIVGGILSKYLPKARFASSLVLPDVSAFNEAPAAEGSPIKTVRTGDQGIVESVCRPVGKVRIGQTLVDAVSDGSIIEAGVHVRVLRREGNRLIVERING